MYISQAQPKHLSCIAVSSFHLACSQVRVQLQYVLVFLLFVQLNLLLFALDLTDFVAVPGELAAGHLAGRHPGPRGPCLYLPGACRHHHNHHHQQ